MVPQNIRKGYLYAFAGIVILIVAHYLGALTLFERAWERMVAGAGVPLSAVMVSIREFSAFHEKQELIKKIDMLEENLTSHQELTVKAQVLYEENRSLREAIAWSETTSRPHIISQIIGKTVNLPHTNVIINRGSRHGIFVGLPVVASSDILIGQIVKTQEETSIVRLLSDSQSKISVKMVGNQEPSGLVVGDLGFALRLKFIPINYPLKLGDIVVTSGLDSNIADNLIVGTVASEIVKTDDFFKESTINSVIPFHKLTTVAVVLPRE